MAKKMYVVFCEDYGTYWCGLNKWDNQLRKAKVFYSLKYANEVHDRYKELKLKNVEIRMELVPENPTHADRIRAMSDDQDLARHLVEIGWNCHLCSEYKRLENEPLLRWERCDEKCVEHCNEWLQQPADQ